MRFDIQSSSELLQDNRAAFLIPMAPHWGWVPIGDPVRSLDVPRGQSIALELHIRFSGRALALPGDEKVAVRAIFQNAVGITIYQPSVDFVAADIQHLIQEETAVRMANHWADAETMCRVECVASGESRTGPRACIVCACSRGHVRLCC